MILEDILSLLLRIGELAFTAVVAGLTGQYLHQTRNTSSWSKKRFIYTEVIAAIGILFSLLFLLPFMTSFVHFPMDFLLFVGLMIAFGLLAHYNKACGSIWNWHGLAGGSSCDKFKADLAFLFLSSVFFLVSGLLGLYVMRKYRAREDAAAGRRGWYRRRARV